MSALHWLGHLLWILFGPGTWGSGGNMVAWVICGGIGFTWMHVKAEARHAEALVQQARHHQELKDHISASVVKPVIEQMSDDEFEKQLQALMRRNPKVLEAFITRAERRRGSDR